MIEIKTKVTVIVRHSVEDGSARTQVRVYPEGYACMAKDDEIAVADDYPITLELEDLDEQTLLIKAIETVQARKQKILDDALAEVAILESRLTELKQITFVG